MAVSQTNKQISVPKGPSDAPECLCAGNFTVTLLLNHSYAFSTAWEVQRSDGFTNKQTSTWTLNASFLGGARG